MNIVGLDSCLHPVKGKCLEAVTEKRREGFAHQTLPPMSARQDVSDRGAPVAWLPSMILYHPDGKALPSEGQAPRTLVVFGSEMRTEHFRRLLHSPTNRKIPVMHGNGIAEDRKQHFRVVRTQGSEDERVVVRSGKGLRPCMFVCELQVGQLFFMNPSMLWLRNRQIEI